MDTIPFSHVIRAFDLLGIGSDAKALENISSVYINPDQIEVLWYVVDDEGYKLLDEDRNIRTQVQIITIDRESSDG